MNRDLIERISGRIEDDARRTGDGDFLRLPEEIRAASRDGQNPLYSALAADIQARAIAQLEPLKPVTPLGEAAVAKVEKSLGFRLPDELRQLYRELGDGGFGPFNGVRRLSNWAKDHAKLRAELPAERGREWPEQLLPIVYRNGKRICIDRTSGAVVLWTKPPKKAGEKKWLASFVPQSPSLGEWLERWVDTPTEAEGGPEGGWAPPGEELARREAVEREKAERRAAELARAQIVAHAELPALAEDLLARVRARALDPERRTYMAAAAARSTPIDLGTLEDEIEARRDVLPPQAAAGLSGLLQAVRSMGALTGMDLGLMQAGPGMMMTSGTGGRLGAPATAHALAHAERRLGFALPAPLRQLYAIADGGFGPGDTGMFSLAQTIERYRKLVDAPQGPADEPWPAKLLPLYREDPAIGCLDLETGRIVVHDPQRMDSCSSQQWRRAFVQERESLAELMTHWLGQPTFQEEHRRAS